MRIRKRYVISEKNMCTLIFCGVQWDSVMKGIFHDGHVFVTTIPRVRVKNMFMCPGHNLICFIWVKKRGS